MKLTLNQNDVRITVIGKSWDAIPVNSGEGWTQEGMYAKYLADEWGIVEPDNFNWDTFASDFDFDGYYISGRIEVGQDLLTYYDLSGVEWTNTDMTLDGTWTNLDGVVGVPDGLIGKDELNVAEGRLYLPESTVQDIANALGYTGSLGTGHSYNGTNYIPAEKPKTVWYKMIYFDPAPIIIYSAGMTLDMTNYQVIGVRNDDVTVNLTDKCDINLPDGYVFQGDSNDPEYLIAIYDDNGYEMTAIHYFVYSDPSDVPRFMNFWLPANETLATCIGLQQMDKGSISYDFTKVYKNLDIMSTIAEYNDCPSFVSCGAGGGWNSFIMQILIDAKKGDPFPYRGRVCYISTDVYGDRYKNADIHITENVTVGGSEWYTIKGGPAGDDNPYGGKSAQIGTIRE
jgi:hypothetical protein